MPEESQLLYQLRALERLAADATTSVFLGHPIVPPSILTDKLAEISSRLVNIYELIDTVPPDLISMYRAR